MRRVFAGYVSGTGIKAIASALTDDGAPTPVAPILAGIANAHRVAARGVRARAEQSLKHPHYTGHRVWARPRKDEVLPDIDNVAAGHVTNQRWNPEDRWQWSHGPAHKPLVSMDDWQATQDVFVAGTRTSATKRRRATCSKA